MKNYLIFLSILVILIPVLMIIQSFAGKDWISSKEYFYLVAIYTMLVILYQGNKKTTDS